MTNSPDDTPNYRIDVDAHALTIEPAPPFDLATPYIETVATGTGIRSRQIFRSLTTLDTVGLREVDRTPARRSREGQVAECRPLLDVLLAEFANRELPVQVNYLPPSRRPNLTRQPRDGEVTDSSLVDFVSSHQFGRIILDIRKAKYAVLRRIIASFPNSRIAIMTKSQKRADEVRGQLNRNQLDTNRQVVAISSRWAEREGAERLIRGGTWLPDDTATASDGRIHDPLRVVVGTIDSLGFEVVSLDTRDLLIVLDPECVMHRRYLPLFASVDINLHVMAVLERTQPSERKHEDRLVQAVGVDEILVDRKCRAMPPPIVRFATVNTILHGLRENGPVEMISRLEVDADRNKAIARIANEQAASGESASPGNRTVVVTATDEHAGRIATRLPGWGLRLRDSQCLRSVDGSLRSRVSFRPTLPRWIKRPIVSSPHWRSYCIFRIAVASP